MIVEIPGGLHLAVDVRGTGGIPLLLLHGFTGSRRDWDATVAALPRERRTVAVDLIGHGESDAPADPERYTLERASADLAAMLDALGIARTHLVGYSLGGRLALRFAVDVPQRLAALVLVSAGAGIADLAERATRRTEDLALADRIERAGTLRFVDEWERSELFASERSLPPARRAEIRAVRTSHGPHGLANSLRGMGQGAMVPLWDRLGEVHVPALVVVGERDARYREIGHRLASRIPGTRMAVIAECGHGIPRERPAELAARTMAFLSVAEARHAREAVTWP